MKAHFGYSLQNLIRYFLLDIYKYIVNISNILSLALTGFLQRCTSAICIEKVRRSFVYFIEIVFDILFFPFSCNYNNDNIFPPILNIFISCLLVKGESSTVVFLNIISYQKVVCQTCLKNFRQFLWLLPITGDNPYLYIFHSSFKY